MTHRPRRRSSRAALALALAVVALAGLAAPRYAVAGGSIEVLDVTGRVPGPIAGTIEARPVPIRWDDRCLPPPHRLNDTLDPVPNPLGPPVLGLADAAATLAAAMTRWTAVPTSYAALTLAGGVSNPGLAGFDMIDEITFRSAPGFDFIAASPSIALTEDAWLADGEDLDGDGDPDVSATLTTCGDADGDGDVERPPGFYPAGTIFDNDVIFNTRSDGYRFTVGDAAVDDVVRSADLEAIAVHELGHSLGLSHVLNDQVGATDGNAATLFPFTDTGDPEAEIAQRSLDADDLAWISFLYPEGTAVSGPAALAPGDVAFDDVYGVVEGEVVDGHDGLGVSGASVGARSFPGGDLVATALSGTARLLLDANGRAVLSAPRSFYLQDGRFRLPVPQGSYRLEMEAVDGAPVNAGTMNFTTLLGAIFGQQSFQEEGWNGPRESAYETRPGAALTLHVHAGHTLSGHRFVTNVDDADTPFGDLAQFGFSTAPAGFFYAVRFPAAAVVTRLDGGESLVAGLLRTGVADASAPALFAAAGLVTGEVRADGTAILDLQHPLDVQAPFLAQENDFAPLFFHQPRAVEARIRQGVAHGGLEDVFLVLRTPLTRPYPGFHALAPRVGLDDGAPVLGRSFASLDGAVFFPETRFNFMFALLYGGH